MKLLLLAAFVSLQLLASAQANNPPPATPPPRPMYFDHVPQDPNRRYARNADDDFQAFFHREVSPIIQSEVHKAIQEVMNDNGRLGGDEEHDRYGRSVNPFQSPPPPRRPIMTDDIRGGNRRWARDTLLNEHLQQELHRERRDLQIPGYKKPTHRDIIIPNWNPNARTQPWQSIGVRHRRSYDSRSHASRGTSSSSSSHDTGRTHPGYNRRNA